MKNTISLLIIFLALTWSCSNVSDATPLPDDGTSKYWKAAQKPFYHGVASGDPLSDRVIIWTRVTPETSAPVELTWKVATDRNMENIVHTGKMTTGPERDFTAKVDVSSLQPNTSYFYQFEALNRSSPVGRTKTAPEAATESLTFAIASCSNFEAGFFNAFARLAERDDINAVLHLGDYIYEYEPGNYGDPSTGRFHLPPKEIVSLSDYRTRYSQYRLDEDFQRVHQQHPFITIWDDHEIANNSYQSGAQNHQPETEGDYDTRANAARQAYYEWLPIREEENAQLYRHIAYGNLVDLIMLDERLAGRTAPAESISSPELDSEERSMLGAEQLAWFEDKLVNSSATWKIIGNQVIFSDVDMAVTRPNSPKNLDAWDGYPAEKRKIINFLKANEVENVIFVSGDTHCSWAYEVPESIAAYKADSTATVAVEFGTTSISSANIDERVGRDTTIMAEQLLLDPNNNPHLKFANMRDHGYLLLTLTGEEAIAEWRYVGTVREQSKEEFSGKTIRVKNGEHEIN